MKQEEKNDIESSNRKSLRLESPLFTSPKNCNPTPHQHFRLRLSMVLGVFVLFLVCLLAIIYTLGDLGATIMFYISGALGVTGGGYVIFRFNMEPTLRSPGLTILYYRTICDVLIGLRFILRNVFNLYLCGHAHCTTDEVYLRERFCALPSGLFEFAEIASEAWFLCAAIDIAIAMTNPFSSFEARRPYYHIFSWGVAFLMAFALSKIRGQSGLWYANSQQSEFAICWVNVSNSDWNYRTWTFLYGPLLFIYIYALYVVTSARKILRNGIPVTFLHRARALYMNSVMLVTFSLYYLLLGILVFLTGFVPDNHATGKYFWLSLLYLMSCKGYVCLAVFVVTHPNFQSDPADNQDASSNLFDLNQALQHEVITYATVGIQHCASIPPSNSNSHRLQIKTPPNNFTFSAQTLNSLANDFKGLRQAMKQSALISNVTALRSQLQLLLMTDKKDRHDLSPDCSSFQSSGVPDSCRQHDRHTRRSSGDYHSDQSEVSSAPHDTNNPLSHQQRITGSEVSGAGERAGFGSVKVEALSTPLYEERYSETAPPLYNDDSSRISSISKITLAAKDSIAISFGAVEHWLRRRLFITANGGAVEFTEYCPREFQDIRRAFGLEEDYMRSFEKHIQNRATEGGASNALFFFSQCNRFIAKSCTAEEMRHVRLKAPLFRDYLLGNRNTLITKIYGAYKLTMYACDLYFIVTNNILHTQDDETIVEKYDLKGSSVHRNRKPPKNGERVRCKACGELFTYNSKNHVDRDRENMMSDGKENKHMSRRRYSEPLSGDFSVSPESEIVCPLFRHEPDCILKDNDMRGRTKLRFPVHQGQLVLQQLEKDCKFLSDVYKVMDYSLLVGVYKKVIPVLDETKLEDSDIVGISRIQAGDYVVDFSYYIGIIDFQQPYVLRKKLETWGKVNVLGQPPDELSCIHPVQYRERFLNFMEDLIL